MSNNAILVSNVSIIGEVPPGPPTARGQRDQGRAPFTIDVSVALADPWKMDGVSLNGWVEKFTIANVLIKNADPFTDPRARHHSVLASINSNQDHDSQGTMRNPSNGIIENITTTGGTWGYGSVQVRSG